ncbi:MAG TPA: F0F1 ATP synthase subunit delta [Hyphomicrobiaceae bacterium]|nr:F0F1 ATP synthase subunit delta [Hyphomicrobiaceae bacterium]
MATDDPMMASVAGRYAAALFDLASDEKKVGDVEADLAKFQSLLDMSADLTNLVKSPLYSADEQSAAIEKLAAKAGIGPLTVNFLKLLIKNRRLFAISDMIKAYRALMARSRGEVTAEVTSAVALNEEQIEELKQTLKASVGKDVQLATRVDPSLLGGLIVKIGSRMVDSSLRTKLFNLRLSLKEAG